MEFADNADDGEVNIFFSLVQKESHADLKKVHSGIKTIAFILFININISFDTDKIIMTFTVFQSGKNSFANWARQNTETTHSSRDGSISHGSHTHNYQLSSAHVSTLN